MSLPSPINTLIIQFSNNISRKEIPLFRGAIIKSVGPYNSLLFHNHQGDEFRYAYPLIQYKRIHQKAAIVCVGKGTEAIGEFFGACRFDVKIGDKSETLEVDNIQARQVLVQIWGDMFVYRIRKWLPLNQENYSKYMALESLAEKYAMLENLLTGNILSFAKGVGIHFEKQVECKITAIDDPHIVTYKDVKMMSFDAEFKSNVSLPDYIGLGKGVSLGCGTVVRRYEKKEYDSNNE